jgi:hypothetical protein
MGRVRTTKTREGAGVDRWLDVLGLVVVSRGVKSESNRGLPESNDVCLFVFISSTMRFSRHGLGASYLATHNHSAIPEVTLKSSN